MGVFIYMGEALLHLRELKVMCIAAVSNVSTVQPGTLSLSAMLLTCISDVPVSVLVNI